MKWTSKMRMMNKIIYNEIGRNAIHSNIKIEDSLLIDLNSVTKAQFYYQTLLNYLLSFFFIFFFSKKEKCVWHTMCITCHMFHILFSSFKLTHVDADNIQTYKFLVINLMCMDEVYVISNIVFYISLFKNIWPWPCTNFIQRNVYLFFTFFIHFSSVAKWLSKLLYLLVLVDLQRNLKKTLKILKFYLSFECCPLFGVCEDAWPHLLKPRIECIYWLKFNSKCLMCLKFNVHFIKHMHLICHCIDNLNDS